MPYAFLRLVLDKDFSVIVPEFSNEPNISLSGKLCPFLPLCLMRFLNCYFLIVISIVNLVVFIVRVVVVVVAVHTDVYRVVFYKWIIFCSLYHSTAL